MIRKMCIEDIPSIQQIDRLCFKVDASRRAEGIKAYMEENNFTSIVYEIDNKVIGYNFIHIWGNFAWFGAFGVHPNYQGREIGKALINETIRIIKNDFNINNIGLITMSDSSYNIGFYMNLGFTPLKLNLGFIKDLPSIDVVNAPSSFEVTEINLSSEQDKLLFINDIKNISNSISQGLDLSSSIKLITKNNFGGALVLKNNNEAKGFALYTTKHIREMATNCIDIKILCISEDINYHDAIDTMLFHCSNIAKKINYHKIHIDCNTSKNDICMYLIKKHNFKIEKSMITMIMGDENCIEKYKGLILCRWAG